MKMRLRVLFQFTIFFSLIGTIYGCDMKQATIQLGESTYTKAQVLEHIQIMLAIKGEIKDKSPFFKLSDEIVYPYKPYGLFTEPLRELFQKKIDDIVMHTYLKVTPYLSEQKGKVRLVFLYADDATDFMKSNTIEHLFLEDEGLTKEEFISEMENPIKKIYQFEDFEEDERGKYLFIRAVVNAHEMDRSNLDTAEYCFLRDAFTVIAQAGAARIIQESLSAGSLAEGNYAKTLYPFDKAFLRAVYSPDIPDRMPRKKAARIIADKIWAEFTIK